METGTGQLEGEETAKIVGGQNQVGENGQRHGGGRQRNQRRCCRAGNRHRNGGRETREDAVGPGTGTGTVEGQERASARTFLIPGTCTIELMNSAK